MARALVNLLCQIYVGGNKKVQLVSSSKIEIETLITESPCTSGPPLPPERKLRSVFAPACPGTDWKSALIPTM